MEESKNQFLETQPIGALMVKYAVPCVISLLVAALYNIADQLFIANADYLGSYGNAANTVVYPMTVIALAFAVLIGDGCCSFVSIQLGMKNRENASKAVGSAVTLSVAVGIILTVIYFVFADPILTAFGGRVNDETFRLSKEYFFYITAGIPFYVFGQAMNPVIRSDGSPRFAMFSTLAGAVVNIILDPIFIYVFHWGMMGAAVATVLGQILTAVLAVVYLARMKTVKLSSSYIRFGFSTAKKYLPLGICSLLAQISLAAAMAAIQNMIKKYGAEDPVFSLAEYSQIPMAVLGIVMKFFQIVISVVIGIAAGCIPIVGYNIGAGRRDRAKSLLTRLLISEGIVGAVALFTVEVFPKALIGIFGAGAESQYYTDFAVKSFRIYLCCLVLACINKAAFIYLQALGKPVQSTALSMVRELIFGVGLSILLPVWFGLDGVLYSMPVSDILTFIITVIVLIFTYRELNAGEKTAVPDKSTAADGKNG